MPVLFVRRIQELAFLVLLGAASLCAQQEPAPQPATTEQAFLIEKRYAYLRFENDGLYHLTQEIRVRLLTQAAIGQFGQLIFEYAAETERFELDFLRVQKADGEVVTVEPSAMQELTAPVSREAPIYTDWRQRHVTVPTLQVGDTLVYRFRLETHTPLVPGHFWFEHSFLPATMILEEILEIDLPADRPVHLKTAVAFQPEVREAAGRRIYRWHQTHPRPEAEPAEAEKKKEQENEEEKDKLADIQLSTFTSWEEIGRWYGALEREQRAVTETIRAQAEALTRDRKTPREKLEALYKFVNQKIRYVSLSFGVGHYRPHKAEQVLANRYGDCKDKHTLLAALAEAVGIEVVPVLIHSERTLDPEVPSPRQFNHLVSAVTLDGRTEYLDTTTEGAPFGLLMPSLRGKKALLIARREPARLVETPADPPFLQWHRIQVYGTIKNEGELEADLRYQFRGEDEVPLRQALRRLPQANWKNLAQALALLLGLEGEVADLQVTALEEMAEPLRLEFRFSQSKYLNRFARSAQLQLPLPQMTLPDEFPEAGAPPKEIELGSPYQTEYRIELELPEGYTARTPVPVRLERDYATYRSDYRLEGRKLIAERHLQKRQRTVPAERMRDYQVFLRAVRADEGQTLAVTRTSSDQPPNTSLGLFEAGEEALRANRSKDAVSILKRLVELEPEHPEAWNKLGEAYLHSGQIQMALEAFDRQIALNPYHEAAYRNRAQVHSILRNHQAAIADYRKQLEIKPLDAATLTSLGMLLLQEKQYDEAAEVLDKAIRLNTNPQLLSALRVSLGQALLHLGRREEALEQIDAATEDSPHPNTLNNVAYVLAVHNLELDRAQRYAEQAVAAATENLRNLSLDRLEPTKFIEVAALAAYWDTLGWIYFRKGDLERAESYIHAAWLLTQRGEVGDHLGQIYEQQGKKDLAVRIYAQAAVATQPLPETRERLLALVGNERKVEELTLKALNELSEARTVALGRLLEPPQTVHADFLLLFVPDGAGGARLQAVRFAEGAEVLRGFTEKLQQLDYPVRIPPDSQVQIPRRAILSCGEATGQCLLVLVLVVNAASRIVTLP
ncbi:MAG: DUF3857 domain-containing protein [Acidobacteriia bacterium]|nr:DUF3857 domain-containing protein [Terriglobia bacterium]